MLSSSSNRKYPPFPLLSYFSVVVCLSCLLHHILSLIACIFRENREFVFIIIVQFMMSANSRIHFALQIVLVCLYSTPSHYHFAKLSEDIELIKCLSDIFCQVCKIKHILSVIHYTICGAVCFQFTHSPCDDWKNMIYTLSYYHHQIGSMNHCLGLGHETMVWAVCLSIFLSENNFWYQKIISDIRKSWHFLISEIHTFSDIRNWFPGIRKSVSKSIWCSIWMQWQYPFGLKGQGAKK